MSKSKKQEFLRLCKAVHRELVSLKHAEYAFPFYNPVDAEVLGIPDYHQIISRPMDLSTIRKKLKQRIYRDALEFATDIRIMFTNCYRYNPVDTDLVSKAKKLQLVFEMAFAHIPSELLIVSDKRNDVPKKNVVDKDSSSDESDNAEAAARGRASKFRRIKAKEMGAQIKTLDKAIRDLRKLQSLPAPSEHQTRKGRGPPRKVKKVRDGSLDINGSRDISTESPDSGLSPVQLSDGSPQGLRQLELDLAMSSTDCSSSSSDYDD